jgi:flagellar hook-length control protein FliK
MQEAIHSAVSQAWPSTRKNQSALEVSLELAPSTEGASSHARLEASASLSEFNAVLAHHTEQASPLSFEETNEEPSQSSGQKSRFLNITPKKPSLSVGSVHFTNAHLGMEHQEITTNTVEHSEDIFLKLEHDAEWAIVEDIKPHSNNAPEIEIGVAREQHFGVAETRQLQNGTQIDTKISTEKATTRDFSDGNIRFITAAPVLETSSIPSEERTDFVKTSSKYLVAAEKATVNVTATIEASNAKSKDNLSLPRLANFLFTSSIVTAGVDRDYTTDSSRERNTHSLIDQAIEADQGRQAKSSVGNGITFGDLDIPLLSARGKSPNSAGAGEQRSQDLTLTSDPVSTYSERSIHHPGASLLSTEAKDVTPIPTMSPNLGTTKVDGSFEALMFTTNATTPINTGSNTFLLKNSLIVAHQMPIIQSPTLQALSEAVVSARETSKGVTVRLDPPELGRVYIDFIFEADRPVTVVIKAETQDANYQLRERAEPFLNLLREQGLNDVTLQFDMSDKGTPNNQNPFSFDETKENLGYSEHEFQAVKPLHKALSLTNLDIRL